MSREEKIRREYLRKTISLNAIRKRFGISWKGLYALVRRNNLPLRGHVRRNTYE